MKENKKIRAVTDVSEPAVFDVRMELGLVAEYKEGCGKTRGRGAAMAGETVWRGWTGGEG